MRHKKASLISLHQSIAFVLKTALRKWGDLPSIAIPLNDKVWRCAP